MTARETGKSVIKHVIGDAAIYRWRRIRSRLWPNEREVVFATRIIKALGGGCAIDVGAHLGLYSIWFATCADRVIAFEANPFLYSALRKTVPSTVVVENMALSDRPGDAVLRIPIIEHQESAGMATVSVRNSFSTERYEGERCIVVAAMRLDDYIVSCLDRTKITFIKIDVEGFEEEVILGALNTIESQMPVILAELEIRHGADIERIFAFFLARGYHVLRVNESGRSLVPVAAEAIPELQSPERLAQKQADLRDTGYANNFFFVPASQMHTIEAEGLFRS